MFQTEGWARTNSIKGTFEGLEISLVGMKVWLGVRMCGTGEAEDIGGVCIMKSFEHCDENIQLHPEAAP